MKDELTNDERFDALMRDAAETFRRPGSPPLETMWHEIEAARFGSASSPRRRVGWWVGIAATLVVGVALGRASMSLGAGQRSAAPPPQTQVATVAPAPRSDTLAAPYDVETSKYLGQAAALLIALPSEAQAGRAADTQFVGRAGELLTRTRLLLDSPAASDPSMRRLLEDLELVLAQVVRLENGHSRTELDLINKALEQRDVIPRLRTAVADISAN
ncbi:MAG: hypothetical protein ACHQWU_03110 [Gemmatimonadales bacterium]|jgi:hypothetical protein